MSNKTKTAIDQAFDELEQVCNENRAVRKQMIEMLQRQIPKCEISECDKALLITAKMSVIKTLDDLLKSDSEMSMRRLKVQLSKKDSETNGMVGQTVVALLKSIRASGEDNGGTPKEIDRGAAISDLKKLQEGNKELEITPGELEQCASTPTSDGNVPVKDEKKEEDEEE